MSPWPTSVRAAQPGGRVITLRPLRRGDRERWEELRARNADRLRPWESSLPTGPEPVQPFRQVRRGFERAAREGRVVPFAVAADDVLVGQMHLFDIIWGSRWTACAGYWLDREATGRGIATWALAMLLDHGLQTIGLHRLEVHIRPENVASLAVARRLGLREEGLRTGLIHVDGAWRDHVTFALTAEELGAATVLSRVHPGAVATPG